MWSQLPIEVQYKILMDEDNSSIPRSINSKFRFMALSDQIERRILDVPTIGEIEKY